MHALNCMLSLFQESLVAPKGDYPPVSGNTKSCEETAELTALSPLCEAAGNVALCYQ